MEPEETAERCAIRELQEEVGLTARRVEFSATLRFLDLKNGFSLEGYAYLVDDFSGTPRSTPEAEPFWCSQNSVPYDQMWEDDRYWLPHVLAGEAVAGDFLFANDKLTEWYLERALNPTH